MAEFRPSPGPPCRWIALRRTAAWVAKPLMDNRLDPVAGRM